MTQNKVPVVLTLINPGSIAEQRQALLDVDSDYIDMTLSAGGVAIALRVRFLHIDGGVSAHIEVDFSDPEEVQPEGGIEKERQN